MEVYGLVPWKDHRTEWYGMVDVPESHVGLPEGKQIWRTKSGDLNFQERDTVDVWIV